MQMKNELPSSLFNIHEQPVTRPVDAGFPGSLPRAEGHSSYKRAVPFRQIVDTPDVLRRHDKKVNRGMGLDILKNNDIFVAINKISFPLSGYDLAKDAFLFHC